MDIKPLFAEMTLKCISEAKLMMFAAKNNNKKQGKLTTTTKTK